MNILKILKYLLKAYNFWYRTRTIHQRNATAVWLAIIIGLILTLVFT